MSDGGEVAAGAPSALAVGVPSVATALSVLGREDGKILDGRNRYAACRLAGVEPAFEVYQGEDPIGWIMSENISGRHLSVGARAMIMAQARSFATRRRWGVRVKAALENRIS